MTGTSVASKRLILVISVLACLAPFPAIAEQRLFETRTFHFLGIDPQAVVLDDFNGDGWLDLATALNATNRVSVQWNNSDGTYGDPEYFYVDPDPVALCSGDLNGDGFSDLVTTSNFVCSVTILLNDGTGLFPTRIDFNTGIAPVALAIGDLDGDLFIDLVTTSTESQSFSILLGYGDGSFQTAEHHPISGRPQSTTIGDLNHDGIADLVVTRGVANAVSVLLGSGGGDFYSPVPYVVGGFPVDTVINDLDGDAHPDLAIVNKSLDQVTVLRGNGDGTFEEARHYETANDPRRIVAVDLNGDQQRDLVTACRDSGGLAVLINDAGEFSPPTLFEAGNPPDVAAGDVDGNGRIDLVSPDPYTDGVSIVFGNGDGTLKSPLQYGTGDGPGNMVTGDVNGDGVIDLVVANSDGGDLSVFLGVGDGTVLPEIRINAGGSATDGLTLGDFNADGRPDLAVTSPSYYSDNYLLVYLGDGAGGFDLLESHVIGEYARAVAAGDLDNDGRQDLAVAYGKYGEGNPGWVAILLGDGSGHFSPLTEHLVGGTPTYLSREDFDLDGNLDLASVNYISGSVSVLMGNGDGTFAQAASYPTAAGPSTLSIGDVNLDGIPDLVTNASLALHVGRGDGTFDPAIFYGMWDRASIISDVNGDGFPDLMTSYEDGLTVLLGNGTTTFEPTEPYAMEPYIAALAATDLDGNGLPDVIVTRRGENMVYTMLNKLHVAGLVAGPGPAEGNSCLVRIFPPINDAIYSHEFTAYGTPKWGVNVSGGDIDGDGLDEILTGPGPGPVFGPHVRGFSSNGTPLPGLSFLAYGTNKYGVNVAAGDFDNDGFDEILTGAGPGAVFGPHVRAFDYDSGPTVTPIPGVSFFAYGTLKWGVNVAAGDLDGDGFDEIVTGAGPGPVFGPHVRGWNVDGSTAMAIPGISFFAYGTNMFGVNVSCGDVDGDGMDEIITAPGPSPAFGAHVRGWNHDGSSISELPGFSFFAWPSGEFRNGATIWAGTDLDHDGIDEIVVGAGPGQANRPEVRGFDYQDDKITLIFTLDGAPPIYTHGVNVAAGRF